MACCTRKKPDGAMVSETGKLRTTDCPGATTPPLNRIESLRLLSKLVVENMSELGGTTSCGGFRLIWPKLRPSPFVEGVPAESCSSM
jgi:hypothetical protein